jgi:hypothetical protein
MLLAYVVGGVRLDGYAKVGLSIMAFEVLVGLDGNVSARP